MTCCDNQDNVVQINVFGTTLAMLLENGLDIHQLLNSHGFVDYVIFDMPKRTISQCQTTYIPKLIDVEVKEEVVDELPPKVLHHSTRLSVANVSTGTGLVDCSLSTINPGYDIAPRRIVPSAQVTAEESNGSQKREPQLLDYSDKLRFSSDMDGPFPHPYSLVSTIRDAIKEEQMTLEERQMETRDERSSVADAVNDCLMIVLDQVCAADPQEDADVASDQPNNQNLSDSSVELEFGRLLQMFSRVRLASFIKEAYKEENMTLNMNEKSCVETREFSLAVNDCLMIILGQVCKVDADVASHHQPNIQNQNAFEGFASPSLDDTEPAGFPQRLLEPDEIKPSYFSMAVVAITLSMNSFDSADNFKHSSLAAPYISSVQQICASDPMDSETLEDICPQEKNDDLLIPVESLLPPASLPCDDADTFFDCCFGEEFYEIDGGMGEVGDHNGSGAPVFEWTTHHCEKDPESNSSQGRERQIEEAEASKDSSRKRRLSVASPQGDELAIFVDCSLGEDADDFGWEQGESDEKEPCEPERPARGAPAKKRPKYSNPQFDGKTFVCQFANCGRKITWKPSYGSSHFLRHAKIHVSWPVLRCAFCAFEGAYREIMTYHHKTRHPQEKWKDPIDCEGPDGGRKMLDLWKECFPTLPHQPTIAKRSLCS